MMGMISRMVDRRDRIEAEYDQRDPDSGRVRERKQAPKKAKEMGKMMQTMKERSELTGAGSDDEASGPGVSEEKSYALVAWVRQQRKYKNIKQ